MHLYPPITDARVDTGRQHHRLTKILPIDLPEQPRVEVRTIGNQDESEERYTEARGSSCCASRE